ncbi:hypothetical protein N7448_011151 [Penicillium atrosanguineum]|nr:hypothetical protein N7448_011151 [Penicillium atrosanguineum]
MIYRQLHYIYSMKTLYMASLVVFVVGSVLSATAPSSPAFIVGRGVRGLGSAGSLAGTNIIVPRSTTLKYRSIYAAICGYVECIALALGSFTSGTISHYSTWRVSFYILIPRGVGILAFVFLSMGHIRRFENAHLSAMDGLKHIDWPGFTAAGVYSWSNWRIVLLLTLAGALLVVFLVLEHRAEDRSLVSLKMLCQRTVLLSSVVTFCNFAHLAAVRGASAFRSGIIYLPLASPLAVAAMASGPLTTSNGYPHAPLILGASS